MANVYIDYDEVIQHTANATLFLIEENEVWIPAKLILEHDQEDKTFLTYENVALEKGLI